MNNEKSKKNKVYDKFWQKKMYRLHKFKLRHIKGVLDSSPPKAFNAKPKDLK